MRLLITVSTLVIATVAITNWADASGNYRKHRIPQRLGADKEVLELGEKIYEGKILRGDEGKACAMCHGDDAKHEFRRSSLRKLDERLHARALECWKNPERFAGDPKAFAPGRKETFALGVYLVTKKRLSKSQIDAFENPPKSNADR